MAGSLSATLLLSALVRASLLLASCWLFLPTVLGTHFVFLPIGEFKFYVYAYSYPGIDILVWTCLVGSKY